MVMVMVMVVVAGVRPLSVSRVRLVGDKENKRFSTVN